MIQKILTFAPVLIIISALLPLVAEAQDKGAIEDILRAVTNTLDRVITILFVLATIYFIWGLIQYIMAAGDEAAQVKAKNTIIWGVIALAAISAVWGMVKVVLIYFLSGDIGAIPTRPGVIPPGVIK